MRRKDTKGQRENTQAANWALDSLPICNNRVGADFLLTRRRGEEEEGEEGRRGRRSFVNILIVSLNIHQTTRQILKRPL